MSSMVSETLDSFRNPETYPAVPETTVQPILLPPPAPSPAAWNRSSRSPGRLEGTIHLLLVDDDVVRHA